jgi:prepilin-type N-terminal cleavage/methylation domain-containing protein/prepilin-type processing-associated H-X9-DG protein
MRSPPLEPVATPVGCCPAGNGAATGAKRRACGFTLMELLVVISLIAVLAALLFPILARLREQGRRAVGLSHLRQLGQAYLLYVQDYDERLPGWYAIVPERPAPFGRARFWTEYFQPYLRSTALFHDPSAVPQEAANPNRLWLADYALATWGNGGPGTPEIPYCRWPGPLLLLGQVVRPTETINLLDGWTATDGTTVDNMRHAGGLNAAFVDGHARWLSRDQLHRVDTDGRGFYFYHYAAADR